LLGAERRNDVGLKWRGVEGGKRGSGGDHSKRRGEGGVKGVGGVA